MSYLVTIDANSWREPNKDEVIARLMSYINGDGVVAVRVDWPDGSSIDLEGEDDSYWSGIPD